jgi:hypothetical protein
LHQKANPSPRFLDVYSPAPLPNASSFGFQPWLGKRNVLWVGYFVLVQQENHEFCVWSAMIISQEKPTAKSAQMFPNTEIRKNPQSGICGYLLFG